MIPTAALIQPVCSCSKKVGTLQQEFERLINIKHLTQHGAADELGLRMMCCRLSVLVNVPMYFIKSSNKFRIKDEVGVINKISENKTSEMYTEDSKLIVLSKIPPEFPLLPGEQRIDHIPRDLSIIDNITPIQQSQPLSFQQRNAPTFRLPF